MVQFCLLPIVGYVFRMVEVTLNQMSSFITQPFLSRDPKALEIVQVILESILLRREKTMRDVDGRRIVDLPPKKVRASPFV